MLGDGSGVGNRLRQVILPTRTRHIVGTTMRIACGVKAKIGIVNHVDEKTRGEFSVICLVARKCLARSGGPEVMPKPAA